MCRVWLSNDRASQASMTDYALEYLDHGIKVSFPICYFPLLFGYQACLSYKVALFLTQVGAVDIDSGWSTGFNNFIFDIKKYPNATEMV